MKRFLFPVFLGGLALFSAATYGAQMAPGSSTEALTPGESETLAYVWELHKYERDRFLGAADCWHMPELASLAYDEELQMDSLGDLLVQFGVPFPSYPDDMWVYSDGFLSGWLDIMFYTCWARPPMVTEHSAYVEEIEVRDLRLALSGTSEASLLQAYNGALLSAYHHLRELAGMLGDPANYRAQVLSQDDVDEILSGNVIPPPEDFVINATFSDTWYYPQTAGQGFFLTVYPGRSEIMLGWFTFDTEFPGESATANLGDPGQRWLTAQGPYLGNRAELTVYSSSGGLFDSTEPVVGHQPVGSIELQFEDCSNGTVTYSLPGIDGFGVIPIRRVAPDNIAACEDSLE